jgi:hypothetical protein
MAKRGPYPQFLRDKYEEMVKYGFALFALDI